MHLHVSPITAPLPHWPSLIWGVHDLKRGQGAIQASTASKELSGTSVC